MPRNTKTALTLASITAAIVIASYGMIHAQTPDQPAAAAPAPDANPKPTQVLEGNYRVTLDFVLSDKTTRSDRVEQVKRIEFHPEYVVILQQNDIGRMIPVHSIGQLRWDPT